MTDPETFFDDPLRPLRGAQFLARFDLTPDPLLVALSRRNRATLVELPPERLWGEWTKLLLKGVTPSRGLLFLHETGIDELLFPELAPLAGCPQDLRWHPEGDVLVHTGLALDAAVSMRTGEEGHDIPLMLAVLCHDLGKPGTTRFEEGRWRSKGHEAAGAGPTLVFLERLRSPLALRNQVVALVIDHLAPAHFAAGTPTPRTFRRLARKLSAAGTSIELLHAVAAADHFGRTSPDALAREFPDGDAFLAGARAAAVDVRPDPDVVLGRHLLARGMAPGPGFGPILERCREVQDETGSRDPEEILRIALADRG